MVSIQLILSVLILLSFTKHVPLVQAVSLVKGGNPAIVAAAIPRGGAGPSGASVPRHSLRPRSGLPPPTNPLSPIYKVRHESDRVVFIFDLPKDVNADDLAVHVNHEHKVLYVKGRRGGLLTSSKATTKLDQVISLADEGLINLHSGRVQFSLGNVCISFSKCPKMENLCIENMD